jgi:hypothetical protein
MAPAFIATPALGHVDPYPADASLSAPARLAVWMGAAALSAAVICALYALALAASAASAPALALTFALLAGLALGGAALTLPGD